MHFLEVKNLSKYINDTPALQDINFHYASFQRLAIAGETGSGKTTLLKAIAGLVQPDNGAVFFEGERVAGPEEKLLPGHPQIAYLSQHFELRNNYRLSDYLDMASRVEKKEAQRIYELCQVDHLLQRRTDQLSGGERQRTALARLLTTSPRLLVLDEPYSNLDGLHKEQMKAVINAVVEENKTACLLVSHDPLDVLPWAEEVLVLREGRIVQQGPPQHIYAQPVDAYTAGLFGDYNLLSAEKAGIIFGAKGLSNGQQLFVRPENMRLARGEYFGQQKGCVTAVRFYGPYVETEVLFGDTKLLVKTLHPSWQKGEIVSANVAPEAVWVL